MQQLKRFLGGRYVCLRWMFWSTFWYAGGNWHPYGKTCAATTWVIDLHSYSPSNVELPVMHPLSLKEHRSGTAYLQSNRSIQCSYVLWPVRPRHRCSQLQIGAPSSLNTRASLQARYASPVQGGNHPTNSVSPWWKQLLNLCALPAKRKHTQRCRCQGQRSNTIKLLHYVKVVVETATEFGFPSFIEFNHLKRTAKLRFQNVAHNSLR